MPDLIILHGMGFEIQVLLISFCFKNENFHTNLTVIMDYFMSSRSKTDATYTTYVKGKVK